MSRCNKAEAKMNPSINPYHAAFSLTYLHALINWNLSEASARDILNAFTGEGIGARIASEQLGNNSLTAALKTVSEFLRSTGDPIAGKEADLINHLAIGFGILKDYRNFYVHQIRSLDVDDEKCEGLLWGLDVKSGYKWVFERLSLEELGKFADRCSEMSIYAQTLAEMFRLKQKPNQSIDKQVFATSILEKLEMPQWPSRLKRTRKNLIIPLAQS